MWQTVGHDKAKLFLERGEAAGRLSHAYLIAGPRGAGRMTLALDLARMVNCTGDKPPCSACGQCDRIGRAVHPDVQVIGLLSKTDGGRSRVNISIDQVRECQRDISLKPFEGKSRVVIFDGAEALSAEAANALLKTLEEPPAQVLIVLVAEEGAYLLPTIVSRCQTVELRSVQTGVIAGLLEDRYGLDAVRAQELADMSGGRPGWAVGAATDPSVLEERTQRLEAIAEAIGGPLEGRFEYANRLAAEFSQDREQGRQVLSLWLDWWRKPLLSAVSSSDGFAQVNGGRVSVHDAMRAVNAVREARSNLERNVVARLATEQMMLQMPYVARNPTGAGT